MIARADVHYAGFWRRFGASLIDSVVITLVLGLIFGPTFANADLLTRDGLLRTLIGMVLTVVLWLKFLGTPGKLLLGCQVVDAKTLGPMRTRQAVVRYLAYFVSILPLFLGFVWIAIDKRKQGFHDKIAKTLVIYNAGLEHDDESNKSLAQLMSEVR